MLIIDDVQLNPDSRLISWLLLRYKWT